MPKTIMTVDDSASIRQMVGFSLKSVGFNVIEARDGMDALSKMNGSKISMMFIDLNMPKLDGIGLIKEIRKNPTHKFIPLIMLTTEAQMGKKMEGKAAGATGWIVKPFKPEQLLKVVKKVLG